MQTASLEEDTLPHAIRQALQQGDGRLHRAQILRWLGANFADRWEDRRIRTYLRGCSLNNPKAIARHPSFPRFLFDCGSGVYEIYDESRHGVFSPTGYGDQISEDSDAAEEIREIVDELTGSTQFAYEAHLRDYLAKNLHILELGLTLWTGETSSSVEFPVGGRRIDILAKDSDGVAVIIELKLSKGHERTLGQALYYRGKLKQMLGLKRVRIIMAAAEITEDLRIASTEVIDVDIFSYALTMQVQKLDLKLSAN